MAGLERGVRRRTLRDGLAARGPMSDAEPIVAPGEDSTERYREVLRRRTARLALTLKVRAAIGLVLLVPSLAGVALAVAFALTAVGVLDAPPLARWTRQPPSMRAPPWGLR